MTFSDVSRKPKTYDAQSLPSVKFLCDHLENVARSLQGQTSSNGNIHNYMLHLEKMKSKCNIVISIDGKGGTMVNVSSQIFFSYNLQDE